MRNYTYILFICLCFSKESESVWWTLGTHSALTSDPVKKAALRRCYKTPQLNTKQRDLCHKYPTLMASVAKGAKEAIEECKIQFEFRRWNCSLVPESGTLFDPILKRASRESAYLHAITAAGVAHAVTTSCSAGNTESCDCDRSHSGVTNKGWTWSGCSSNVKFGSRFSEQFTDARARGNSPRAVMTRHNSRAGRKALSKLLWRKCKCHGLSGSCSMRTCWMQQPSFRQVGDYLNEKYEGAAEMIIKLNRRKKERLKPRYPHKKRPTESDLLFYESSPNYCDADASEGSLGTSGRECNISSSGMNGCELLCCGRGHNIQQTMVTRNCNCVFLWCCQVKCQECKEIVNKYTCK